MDLIGIDVGGTKVSICLGDEEGNIIDHKRIPTAQLKGPDTGLPQLVEQVGHLLRDHNLEVEEIRGIGLALPGPLSVKEGVLIAPPNLPEWKNVPIVRYFRERLGRPVFVNNDANAGALAEWEFGSAKHADNLVYLTMSTGMGGGVVTQGKLLLGGTDTAGEVGHFVLDPQGPPCPCGQKGCFEVYCGGANVAHRLQERIKRGAKTRILEEAGSLEKIDMKSVTAAVKKGDALAIEVWEEYIERLAQGIGILLMTLNPDAILLGTIAMHEKELVMKPLLNALPYFSWNIPFKHCRIEPSILGDDIGKLGALALAIEGLRQLSS